MAAVVAFAAGVLSKVTVIGLMKEALIVMSLASSIKAMTAKKKSSTPVLGSGIGAELTMSRDPAPVRRVVYGETRVSGPMAFCHVSGSDNSALGCVVLLAAHECQGIAYHYVDDALVYPDPSTGAVTFGPYAGKLSISSHLGDQTTADSGLVSSSGGAWGSSYVLRGITYIACRLTYDADVYSGGLPNFSVVLRGKKVLDPRTSTTAFSRNPALILRDYLTNDDYGLGATSEEIDDASFIAAANVCDESVSLSGGGTEPRYRCDGSFTTDAEPASVIEQILATMAGSLVYAGGKFRCNAGAYYIQTVTLDEGDLRGPIQYQTAAGIREVCNIVKGTYTSTTDLYQPRDFPQYKDAEHVTADGEDIVEDLDLAWVSSSSQAQRLAKMHEKSSRMGGTITLQCNLSAMRVQAGDTVAIENARFGWAPKVFVVQEFRFAVGAGGALGVDLVCRETASSIFGWVASDETTVLPGLTITNPALNNGVVIQASLDNDSATVPSAADGSSPVLGPAVTTIAIYRGAIDDSANWAVSASPSAGVTGTLDGKTWTTTGFTVDAGYVDFTATRSGYSAITVRFVLAKARAGASGANGADGPAAFTLINDANCTVGPNWIQRTTGSGAWNAAAHTRESYVGGAFCSFQFDGAVDFVCGLTTDPTTDNSYTSIDYAWHGSLTTDARIFENGAGIGIFGGYTSATVFSIVYDGRCVKYLKDGVVQRTVDAPPNLQLYFDSAVSTLGCKATNIAFGPSGAAGADATSYWLVASASTMKLSSSVFTPPTVTFTGKAQVGAGAPGNYACRFWIAESTDGSNFTTKYTSTSDEVTKTWTPTDTTVKAVRCRMYQAGGAAVVLDEETVTVIADPTPGFTGGGGSGGGTVNLSWACPSGLSVTRTVPTGSRSIQFTGQMVNTGGTVQTLSYGIRVAGSSTPIGEFSATTGGQTFPISFTRVVDCAAGSVTFEFIGKAGSSSALLSGQFIIL